MDSGWLEVVDEINLTEYNYGIWFYHDWWHDEGVS